MPGCRLMDLNHRRSPLQGDALPTELNRRGVTGGSRTLIYGTTTRGFSVKLRPQYPWTVTLRLFLRVKQVRYFYNTGAFNGDFLFYAIFLIYHTNALFVYATHYTFYLHHTNPLFPHLSISPLFSDILIFSNYVF